MFFKRMVQPCKRRQHVEANWLNENTMGEKCRCAMWASPLLNVKWQWWKAADLAEKSVSMMIPIDANVFRVYAHYTHFFPEEENVHWLFAINKNRWKWTEKKRKNCSAGCFVQIQQNKTPHHITSEPTMTGVDFWEGKKQSLWLELCLKTVL